MVIDRHITLHTMPSIGRYLLQKYSAFCSSIAVATGRGNCTDDAKEENTGIYSGSDKRINNYWAYTEIDYDMSV